MKTLNNGKIGPLFDSLIWCPCGNSRDRKDENSPLLPSEAIPQSPSCDAHLEPPGCPKPVCPSESICFHFPSQAPGRGKVIANWLQLWIPVISQADLQLLGKHILFPLAISEVCKLCFSHSSYLKESVTIGPGGIFSPRCDFHYHSGSFDNTGSNHSCHGWAGAKRNDCFAELVSSP